MCLSAIIAADPDHANFKCIQNLFYWSPSTTPNVYTLVDSLVTNTSDAARLFVFMHLVPRHATIIPTDHLDAVTALCEQVNTICAAPTYARAPDVPVFRSMALSAPHVPTLRLDEVEVKLAPGGCFQITLPTPLPNMQDFLNTALGAIPADATPDVIVAALHAINEALAKPDQLGLTGFRPVAVPTAQRVLDAGVMDTYQSAVQGAMMSACGMLVVKMAAEQISHSCGGMAPVILREIFSGTPTARTFDVSKRFDQPDGGLDETQRKAMGIRDMMAAHLDCNYVMFCTSMIGPDESTKAVMMLETAPGQEVPFPGQCHEDGNRTTETNIVLGSPMCLDLSKLVAPGEDPKLGYMDKDRPWNAAPPAQDAPGPMHAHYATLNKQRECRDAVLKAMHQDHLEPVTIFGATRLAGERPLEQRVVSVECTLMA